MFLCPLQYSFSLSVRMASTYIVWQVSNWLIFRLIINFYLQRRKMGNILCTGTEHSATSSLLAKSYYCLCQQSSLLIKHWFIIIYSHVRLFCPHISYCTDTNRETFFKEIFVSMFSKHDYWEILRRNMWIFWEIRSILCLWVRLALCLWALLTLCWNAGDHWVFWGYKQLLH